MEDEFEWDPVKASENLAKHKVSFDTAIQIFAGQTLEGLDEREDYGEDSVYRFGCGRQPYSGRRLHMERRTATHQFSKEGNPL
jgi:uncharacterized DUF497 family protein